MCGLNDLPSLRRLPPLSGADLPSPGDRRQPLASCPLSFLLSPNVILYFSAFLYPSRTSSVWNSFPHHLLRQHKPSCKAGWCSCPLNRRAFRSLNDQGPMSSNVARHKTLSVSCHAEPRSPGVLYFRRVPSSSLSFSVPHLLCFCVSLCAFLFQPRFILRPHQPYLLCAQIFARMRCGQITVDVTYKSHTGTTAYTRTRNTCV